MKDTTELMTELSSTELSEFLSVNTHEMQTVDVVNFWNGLINECNEKKSDIISRCEFNSVYFYEVISGKKTPSRDKVLMLLLGMRAQPCDAKLILNTYCLAGLYPRRRRDSVIIYALNLHMSVREVNEYLQKIGEKPLQ